MTKETKKSIIKNPICCLCNKSCEDEFGNNPAPLKSKGRCCNICNSEKVIPTRIINLLSRK